jgi:agmatine/peptidylarginine deiminase
MNSKSDIRFPAEWEPQSGVQLTWPHEDTDWKELLGEVIPCFAAIAKEIAQREGLLIVCRDADTARRQLGEDVNLANVRFCALETNDTWARDHAPLSVFEGEAPCVCDFSFNGWGMKFPANFDNQITRELVRQNAFRPEVSYRNMLSCVLEGGSLESDGKGTILTTEACLLSPNRNDALSKDDLDAFYRRIFGAERILWLRSGYLAGDDTDSHVDTLARFCSEDVIAYVACDDAADEHYGALKRMEEELRAFRTLSGNPYALLPLPMADIVIADGHRLPATYANFLIVNGAVLLPTYGSPKDEVARAQLQKAFPGREIVGIDCSSLIKQHGSLHCVTMQYPEGFLAL